MNKEDLQKACSNLLGVSSSEKELAFEILQQKILEYLRKDGEAIRIEGLGVFQYKENQENNTAELIYSQLITSSKKTIFVRIPVKKSDDVSAVEDIFSLSVGKPVVPLKSAYQSSQDSEVSFIFIKRKIEERVSEILQQSELLSGFNLWDDYIKDTSAKESSKQEPESSQSVLQNISEPDPEPESIDLDDSILTSFLNESELYSFPEEKNDQPDLDDDELFRDLETFKNIDEQENISTQEIFDESISESDLNGDKNFNQDSDTVSTSKSSFNVEESDQNEALGKDDIFDLESSIFKDSEDSKKFDWNWGDELKIDIPDLDDNDKKESKPSKKDKHLEEKSIDDNIDSDPFGTLEQTLQLDPEFKKLTGGFKDVDYSRMRDEEYRITNLNKPRPIPPTRTKTRFTRLTSPVEDLIDDQEESEPISEKKPRTKVGGYKSFRDRKSDANILVIGGIIIILAAIIYFAFSIGDTPSKEVMKPNDNNISQSERQTDIVTSEPLQTITPVEESINQVPENRATTQRDNSSQVEEIRISNLIFRRGNDYNIQVSSWRSPIKAEEEMNRLKNRGYNAFIVQAFIASKGGTWHRVRIGGFKSEDEARNFLNNTQL